MDHLTATPLVKRTTAKRAIHYVYLGDVRVALSHRGRPVPQWLADAAGRRFVAGLRVRSPQVEDFLRGQFPGGSVAEIYELATKLARALRRSHSSGSAEVVQGAQSLDDLERAYATDGAKFAAPTQSLGA